MNTSVEAWRIKAPNSRNTSSKQKPQPKEQTPVEECDVTKSPCCETCRYVKSKTCGSQHKKLRCRQEHLVFIPPYASLTQSVKTNGRFCCCTLGRFFCQAGRVVRGEPGAGVGESLAQLSEVVLALANDCVLCVGRLSRSIVRGVERGAGRLADGGRAAADALARKLNAKVAKLLEKIPKAPTFAFKGPQKKKETTKSSQKKKESSKSPQKTKETPKSPQKKKETPKKPEKKKPTPKKPEKKKETPKKPEKKKETPKKPKKKKETPKKPEKKKPTPKKPEKKKPTPKKPEKKKGKK